MITSKDNPRLKLARSLAGRARERQSSGAMLVEGARLVEEAFRAGCKFRFTLLADDASQASAQVAERLKREGLEVEVVASRLLRPVTDTETPQGLVSVIENFNLLIPEKADFVLVPDQVRDPGNMGTLIRSADAAGVQVVLVPPESTDPFSPKAVRAGMGAHFRIPILSSTWPEIRQRISGLRVLLADVKGVAVWGTNLRQPLVLIVGGEAQGASHEAVSLAAERVSVPMKGQSESLNAAVAGSIVMFEVARQRA